MLDFPDCSGRRVRPFRFAPSLMLAPVLFAVVLLGLPASSPAALGDCSQPVNAGDLPKASDCIFVLRAAIGLLPCQLCVCDTNGSTGLSAADALLCLKVAVGQNVNLNCPGCGPTTTTTTTQPGPTSSTTTSSTSSTTSTLPVSCESNADCSSLGPPFRCNPFTGNCDKPCNSTRDCQGFLECNNDQYCVPPLLLY